MPDGFGYVLATYSLTVVTIVIWFWMMLVKLARQRAKGIPASLHGSIAERSDD